MMKFKVLLLTIFVLIPCSKSFAALGDIITSWGSPSVSPRGLAWDGTNLWNSDEATDMIYKLDPATGNILDSFAAGSVNPTDLTFVGSDLWNADIFIKEFYSVDPSVGPPWTLEFSKPGSDYFGLEYDGTNLWAANITLGQIEKLDLAGNLLSSFPSPGPGTAGLAWDGTYLWNVDAGDDMIYKLDPVTGNVLDSFSTPLDDGAGGLTFDGSSLWYANQIGTIYQLDIGLGATPVPPGIVTLLTMLGGLGGYAGLGKLRRRRQNNDTSNIT